MRVKKPYLSVKSCTAQRQRNAGIPELLESRALIGHCLKTINSIDVKLAEEEVRSEELADASTESSEEILAKYRRKSSADSGAKPRRTPRADQPPAELER